MREKQACWVVSDDDLPATRPNDTGDDLADTASGAKSAFARPSDEETTVAYEAEVHSHTEEVRK